MPHHPSLYQSHRELQEDMNQLRAASRSNLEARSDVSDSDVEAWIPDCHEYQCDYQCDLNLFQCMDLEWN